MTDLKKSLEPLLEIVVFLTMLFGWIALLICIWILILAAATFVVTNTLQQMGVL